MPGLTPATDLHHVAKVSDGGSMYQASNIMPLCHACHSKRTAKGE